MSKSISIPARTEKVKGKGKKQTGEVVSLDKFRKK